jgi:ABC-type bacteriocin/lantibiotic exporter with double-glycine peptidase domain
MFLEYLTTIENADQILVLDQGRMSDREHTQHAWPSTVSTHDSTHDNSAKNQHREKEAEQII